MSDNLEAARDFILKGLKAGPSDKEFDAEIGGVRAQTEIQFFTDAAKGTNGQLTDALFSPFITELAKEISGDDNPTIDDKVKPWSTC